MEIEIPARSAYVGVVRLALASAARAAGFEDEVIEDLKIAVSEACANAVLANEESGSDEPVTVSWRLEGEAAVVEIGDRGARQGELMQGPEEDGQGFSTRLALSHALLTSLATHFEFVPRGGGGMLSRLTISRRTVLS